MSELISKNFETHLGVIQSGPEATVEDVLRYFNYVKNIKEQERLFNLRLTISGTKIIPAVDLFSMELLKEAIKEDKKRRMSVINNEIKSLKEELKRLKEN